MSLLIVVYLRLEPPPLERELPLLRTPPPDDLNELPPPVEKLERELLLERDGVLYDRVLRLEELFI